jgi:hypothetical protein
MKIEGINKEERKEFKNRLASISNRYSVKFNDRIASVEYSKPYIITEEELSLISKDKKALMMMINEFRVYQFNQ